ncbi:glycosyltransferase [Aquabacter sp. P-9]|uniref:glycosyltransferase n=1 Tax=Aquabacter sediminis TaxID=3029197 RepID=UPI00237E7B2A|nr:glycosyltransferase [Aquabacter sp. P-9]MDE1569294.1 glycosyltransferase [Aquabacter sp. P-9]
MQQLERFTPDMKGRIAYEHMHRYAVCRDFVRGLQVLDVGCGDGYGTALLGECAARITGIDVDAGSVGAAAVLYGVPGKVLFQVGSAFELPFADECFDVVTALEIIEHVTPEQQEKMVAEIHRVLRPGGLFIVSTPNKPVYNRFKAPNVFHLNEFDKREFAMLLGKSFKHVHLLGQRMALVSSLGSSDKGVPLPKEPAYRGYVGEHGSGGLNVDDGVARLPDPEYFLAFCSTQPVEWKVDPHSVFYCPDDDLWFEHDKTLAWASGLHEEDEALRKRVAQLEQWLATAERDLAAERTVLAPVRTDLEAARAELEVLRNELGRLREAGAELLRVQAIATEYQQQLEHISGERAHLRNQVESLQGKEAELVHAQANSAELERQIEQLAGERDDLRVQIALAAEERDQTASARAAEIQERDAALSLARVSNDTLQRKIAEQERELDEARAHAEVVSAEIAILKATAQHAEDRSAELAEELERRNFALKAALDNAAQLASALRDAQLTIHDLQCQGPSQEIQDLLQTREDEVEALRAALEAGREEICRLQDAQRRELSRALAQRMEALTHGAVASLRARIASERRYAASEVRDALRREQPRLRTSRPGRRARSALQALGLVDAPWYLARTPEAGADALAHFVRRGVKDGLEPHPLFHSYWFASRHPGALNNLPAPFAYASSAERPRLSPHPFFLPDYYLERNPDVAEREADAFAHFRAFGEGEHRPVHPLIDLDWMAGQMPELRQDARWLSHYATNPALFHLSPHPLFDPAYYLSHSPDVAAAGVHPLLHYLVWGWREGRSPHAYFEGDWYLARNRDVLSAGENPLVHFVWHGAREGRDPNPAFQTQAYTSLNPDVAADGGNPFVHYLLFGRAEGRSFSRDPDVTLARQFLAFSRQRRSDLFGEMLDGEEGAGGVDEMLRRSETADLGLDLREELPVIEYWLPQAANDYLSDSGRSGQINLYRYLYAAIERFSDAPLDFLTSQEFRALFVRARFLSTQRAMHQKGQLDASIIIPIYRNLLDTLACLVSLLEQETDVAYEIIIGDDKSPDATPDILSGIGGVVQVVRHTQNLGFLGNCNRVAEFASGRNVVFLNNDTLILSGWLDRLVGTLDDDPGIGLVGSKLLNWDGTLQEAGGIFWKDGSAWNFGRNQDPRRPEFNYLKDADYCSGAAIALPTAVWRELEGFDPHFSPAYCEDADIAFRVRAKGMRSVYQPFAEVIHHEGRSHGRDVSSGIKAYQVSNTRKLIERWGEVLEREHFPNGEDVFLARDHSAAKPHILFVDHYVPQWDRDAGSRTIYQYIRLFLDKGFRVTFWPDNLNRDKEYTLELQKLGVEVIYGSGFDYVFEEWIKKFGDYFDYAFLSRPHVSQKYVYLIRCHSSAKVFYYGHDIHGNRLRKQYELTGSASLLAEAKRCDAMEYGVCVQSDVVFYPGEVEAAYMRSRLPANVQVVAFPITILSERHIEGARTRLAMPQHRDPHRLMFVGGFSHTPNVDGIVWFVNEVMPILRSKGRSITLDVAGSNAPRQVLELAAPDVRICGRVSDEELAELYHSCALSVVPLRYGAGVKGKVIEAMGQGTPVVMTPVGAQGIENAEDISFVAEAAEDFASMILRAIDNPRDAQDRALKALAFIDREYSQKAIERLLGGFVPEFGAN